MPHLEGKCRCGRKIRLPKHASLGYEWTCYKCGKTWTLSTHGQPLHRAKSLPPRNNSHNQTSPSSGCLVLFTMPFIGFLLAKYLFTFVSF